MTFPISSGTAPFSPGTGTLRPLYFLVFYTNTKASNTCPRLKCQLNRFLQESDNVMTNPNGATCWAERNCGHDLALILRIHRLFSKDTIKVSQERWRWWIQGLPQGFPPQSSPLLSYQSWPIFVGMYQYQRFLNSRMRIPMETKELDLICSTSTSVKQIPVMKDHAGPSSFETQSHMI